MSTITVPPFRPLASLPAIYAASIAWAESARDTPRETESFALQADAGDQMLPALLDTISALYADIDRTIATLDQYFDPWTAPAKPITMRNASAPTAGRRSVSVQAEPDFLNWLSTWVGLENLDEVAAEPGLLEQRQRQLVKHAVELYRSRGTREGLQALLKAFFDIDVEIHEWTAPEGMRIGTTSTIGVDTVLMPDVPPERSFLVVWAAPKELREGLKAWKIPVRRPRGKEEAWIETTVVRAQEQVDKRSTADAWVPRDLARWWGVKQEGWLPTGPSPDQLPPAGAPAGRWDDARQRWIDGPGAGNWVDDEKWAASMPLRTKAQRIARAIERERPVDTYCYLALAWKESSKPTDVFTVEITSTIEATIIESMG